MVGQILGEQGQMDLTAGVLAPLEVHAAAPGHPVQPYAQRSAGGVEAALAEPVDGVPAEFLEQVVVQRGVAFEVPDAMEEERAVTLQIDLDGVAALLLETPYEGEFVHVPSAPCERVATQALWPHGGRLGSTHQR